MPQSTFLSPARGAYVELSTLVALRFPARQLQLLHRSRALSALTGPNKSNFRGRGIDFEEVRNYQPGDEVRAIDWRVTARTGEAHTKLFREERERPVLLVVDQRPGMFFGSSHCFKSVLAAQLAALLAWAALDGGDRVGGIVFNGEEHRELRPRRSRRTVLGLLSETCRFNTALPRPARDEAASLDAMLGQLRHVARPGSNVFLISDFAGFSAGRGSEHLFELARHTQVTAIACHDPLETELPAGGRYTATDGNASTELDTRDAHLRRDYTLVWRAERDALRQQLRRRGIPLLEARTDHSPLQLLQACYGKPRR